MQKVISTDSWEKAPQWSLKELAFLGRSNAGKSTLINKLLGSKLAYVSRRPGKTRLIHLYPWKFDYALVDLPGYGFAARSFEERKQWKFMIEGYLKNRTQLEWAVLIIDIRRDWAKEEQMIYDFCRHYRIPLIVVLTKADKLNAKEKKERLNYWAQTQKTSPCLLSEKAGGSEWTQQFLKILKTRDVTLREQS